MVLSIKLFVSYFTDKLLSLQTRNWQNCQFFYCQTYADLDFEAEAPLGEIGAVVEIAEKILLGIFVRNSCEIATIESQV